MLSDKLMSNSRIQSYTLDLDQKEECDIVTQSLTSLSYACVLVVFILMKKITRYIMVQSRSFVYMAQKS